MSKNKERLMSGLLAFLLFSNVFAWGKMFALQGDEKEQEINGFIASEELNEEIPVRIEDNEVEKNESIMVHISGACKNPGVYTMSPGSRLFDVLNSAGGELSDADLNAVNLSKKVNDEEKIYIPFKGESPENMNLYIQANNNETGLININNADKSMLKELPGVGEKTAEKIISYRENNRFSKIEDIMNVSGIGKKKFEDMKDFICVD